MIVCITVFYSGDEKKYEVGRVCSMNGEEGRWILQLVLKIEENRPLRRTMHISLHIVSGDVVCMRTTSLDTTCPSTIFYRLLFN
jgi:hypothetical protein